MIHILEVDSVILTFGDKRVLQDVYLKSETGKITGLLGRNGAGKSCLMNIVYGKLIAKNQSVRIDRKVLTGSYRKPKDMRFLPQFNFIPKSLIMKRVFHDFGLGFDLLIKYFPEFEKYYNTQIRFLSGGEQRVVELFVVLMASSKFCLLDEPFSHIMPIHVDTIKKLILQEKAVKGIIITDHMYKHILEISDDVYVINHSKIWPVKTEKEIAELGYLRQKQENL